MGLFESILSINFSYILFSLLLAVIVAYICKIWNSYKYFSSIGIKTPPYRFFYGNFPEIRENKNFSDVIRKWTETYGKIYGYYQGHTPILVTSDLDFIQEVFIKQYSNFTARKKPPMHRGDDDNRTNLFNAARNRWKKMRTIINPTFSSAKLRELNPLLAKCTDRLVGKLKENQETKINVSEYLKRFTMDTIWNCAFGIDIDLQNDPNNQYLAKSESIFSNSANFTKPMYVGTYFPEISPLLAKTVVGYNLLTSKILNSELKNPFLWLVFMVREIVKHRKSSPTNKRDFLQLLLETESDESSKTDKMHNVDYTTTHIEKRLTSSEIERNLVLFMLAGYETTSTALTYIMYVLATIPEEQEKLRQEIEEHFPIDGQKVDINADTVQKLEYLDMFIREVLRMYPIGNSVINRRCIKSTVINGIQIPEDVVVQVDVLSIHFDEEIWGPDDPNKFCPKRFSPEYKRNPNAFLAFGEGPRFCIGMKFALLEIKIALCNILRQFEVLKTEDTPKQLSYIEGVVRSPKEPIIVSFKKR